MSEAALDCARYIREIGRGRDNARALSREDARLVWGALLDDRIADLEVGAILLAMRIKGESVDEIAGFLDATDVRGLRMPVPRDAHGDPVIPLVIPTYNGARNMANLTPLLACLLAREGVPVLVHGKVATRASDADRQQPRSAHAFDTPAHSGTAATAPPPRITTAEIFETMGLPVCRTLEDADAQVARGEPIFMAINDLNPPLARVLALRRQLGVRSPAHTLVKLLQPFAGPALRLASYTHPEYHTTLSTYFTQFAHPGAVLLMRGTEGEPVANARRPAMIERFLAGQSSVLVPGETGVVRSLPILPESRDAATTALWIQAVLSGERPVPEAIEAQCEAILATRRTMQAPDAAQQAVG
ncbi:MAG: DNA-binding protein YbiB [Burkholderiaceae bacterium]